MDKLTAFTYKIKTDTPWYMENFLKIRDKKQQLIPFKINEAQQEFQRIIDENTKNGKPHRYIILKARQLGFSTFTEGKIFHDTVTRENTNSLIIAHEDKATQNLFQMSKLFYEELPASLKPMKKYSNEKALVFENPTTDVYEKQQNPGLRSKITCATAGTSDTARSGTYHNIHVSELAFFPNAQNTMTALLQCVPDEPNTFVCLESTANGIGGYFYDMWNDACEGKNDFTPLFFPWFTDSSYSTEFENESKKEEFIKEIESMVPDSAGKMVHTEEWYLMHEFNLTLEQLYWRKKTIANKCGGDLEMFHQEYPATPQEAFIASGRPRFDVKVLREYEMNCTEPEYVGFLTNENNKITFRNEPEGFLKIWQYPNSNKSYTIGIDVAEGLETGDYSVATVCDEQLNVVAKWRGHIDPDLLGIEAVNLGLFYNEAYIAVENNNHGLTTLKSILRHEYYNVFYTKSYDRVNDVVSKKLGWSTTRKTKPYMIDKLAEYIRERYLGIKDKDIIMECYSYVIDEKGITNAQEGKHDDCVMSLGITLMAVLEEMGQDYVPEVPKETAKSKKKTDFDIPEIIDPLFEEDEHSVEYT